MKSSYLLGILVVLLIVVPAATAWSSNYNNGELWYAGTVNGGTYGLATINGISDTVCLYTEGGYNQLMYYQYHSYIVTPNLSSSEYWAYTYQRVSDSDQGYGAGGGFNPSFAYYNSADSSFYGYSAAQSGSIPSSNYDLHRIEIVRSGTNVNTYIDGTLNQSYSSVPGTPIYSLGMADLTLYGYVASRYYHWDDVSASEAFADTALISVMPHSWHIKKDMIDPSDFGMFNSGGSVVYSDHFDVQWSLGAFADGWQATQSPPDTRYKITIAAPSGMKVYDNYIKISDYGRAAGIVSVPMNRTYIGNQPLEYGMYWVTLYDGTAVKSQDYFYVLGEGATVTWNQATYLTGSTPTVTYSISDSYYDTATYNYEIKIMDVYGTVKKTQAISGKTGSISFTMDSSSYPDGVYYAIIYAVQKSDDKEIAMAYSTAEVNSYIPISGYVVDQNGIALNGVSVNVTQGTSTLISTSNASGYYSSENNWLYGSEINITTSLSGYVTDYNLFTPPSASEVHLNITLINSTATHTAPSINGVLKDNLYHSTIPSATVYERVNGTTTTPNATSANIAGYYIFNELTNTTVYDLWGTKTGYADSEVYQVTCLPDIARRDIYLTGTYTLTLTIKDTDGNVIPVVTVSDSNGYTTNTTNGVFTHSYTPQTVAIYLSSSGYVTRSISYVMDQDRNETVQMTATGTQSQNTNIIYTQQQVRFIVMNSEGTKVNGATISASVMNSTLPSDSLTILQDAFGISANIAGIMLNGSEVMSGTTAGDGSLTFMMFPSLTYNLTITGVPAAPWYISVSPRETEYTIHQPTANATSSYSNYLNTSITITEPNSSYITLNAVYQDLSGKTTNVDYYVIYLSNKTLIYHRDMGNPGTSAVTDNSVTLPNIRGVTYWAYFNKTTA